MIQNTEEYLYVLRSCHCERSAAIAEKGGDMSFEIARRFTPRNDIKGNLLKKYPCLKMLKQVQQR